MPSFLCYAQKLNELADSGRSRIALLNLIGNTAAYGKHDIDVAML